MPQAEWVGEVLAWMPLQVLGGQLEQPLFVVGLPDLSDRANITPSFGQGSGSECRSFNLTSRAKQGRARTCQQIVDS
jgi:hypothetical protein